MCVASMSGVVLGGVIEVVGSNLAGGKIFTTSIGSVLFVCLFDLILYVPSTIFHLNRDRSSWVGPVISNNKCVFLKDTT